MNKEELFECLSGLSQTNNLRDGIDIRKEEANIIVNEIERLKNIIKEVKEIFKDYGVKEDIVGYTMYNITGESLLELLEILDKEKQDV